MNQESVSFIDLYFQYFEKSFQVEDFHSPQRIELVHPSYLHRQLELGQALAISRYHGRISIVTMKTIKKLTKQLQKILKDHLKKYSEEYKNYLNKNSFDYAVLGATANETEIGFQIGNLFGPITAMIGAMIGGYIAGKKVEEQARILYDLLINAIIECRNIIYTLFDSTIIPLLEKDLLQSTYQPFQYSIFDEYPTIIALAWIMSFCVIFLLGYYIFFNENESLDEQKQSQINESLIEIHKLKQELEKLKVQQGLKNEAIDEAINAQKYQPIEKDNLNFPTVAIKAMTASQPPSLINPIQLIALKKAKTQEYLNKIESIGIDLIPLRGGQFHMGYTNGNKDEKPVHLVSVNDYYLSKTEITVAQYAKCVEAGECTLDEVSNHANCTWGKDDDYPMTCLSWHQARTFALWLSADLPTEIQWEYAAKSQGLNQLYPWGNQEPNCELAIVEEYGIGSCGTQAAWPVCSKPKGNTAQGLCDMTGNVWEWLVDEYHSSYKQAPMFGAWCSTPDCVGSYKTPRVGRGGPATAYARTSAKTRSGAHSRSSSVGFRIAFDPNTSEQH